MIDFSERYRKLQGELQSISAEEQKIIDAYKHVKPPHPETIVWYEDGAISSIDILGELNYNKWNAIPNARQIIKVDVGNSVTSIGNTAFGNTTNPLLREIYIPYSVSSVGSLIFQRCNDLSTIVVDENNPIYDSRNNCNAIVLTEKNLLWQGCYTTTIQDSISAIGQAFRGNEKLLSVSIPDSVKSIAVSTFAGCKNLSCIECESMIAPSAANDPFGWQDTTYTGRNTYNTENNVLKVPQGATGYDSGAWADPLQNSTKCGFHIEYLD